MADSPDKPRDQWGSKIEFVLSCIGLSVGLGNIWRFPYLVYTNGGGAFLVPYVIILTFIGRPMYYMELILGQFCGFGVLRSFRGMPLSTALNKALMRVCRDLEEAEFINTSWMFCDLRAKAMDGIHCSPLAAQAVSKLLAQRAAAFLGGSPHITARLRAALIASNMHSDLHVKRRAARVQDLARTYGTDPHACSNLKSMQEAEETAIVSTVSLAAQQDNGITFTQHRHFPQDYDHHRYPSCLSRVVLFTSFIPFFILGILLVRGMTLVGAGTGLYYYLVPTWKKILEPKVWQKAAEQVFFSLSVAEGMIYSLGSYNHFHNSLYRDVYIIAFADLLVSFVAGLVVFSVLGHMAYNLNVSIQDVVDAGFGLAFVVYPESVTLLAWPNLWSFVFFVMLFFLALASEVSLVEGVLTPIKDEFPACQRHPTRLAFTFCALCFFTCLPMATKVWQKAAEQVFFSLSVAEGMIYSLGSYNHFYNSLYRDVYIIAFADLLVSFVAGLVVFSVLGHMAYNLNVSIQDVVDAGFGLAFVVYPESVTLLAWPNLWSFVFFVMLFFLALASEVSLVEGVLTPIKDEFPACQRHPTRLAFTFCALCFFTCLPMATKGGIYVLNFLDTYIGGVLLFLVALFEAISLSLVYGVDRFALDCEFMMGSPPGILIKLCWKFLCPIALTGGIYVLNFLDTYIGGVLLFLVALFEAISLSLVYGVDRFALDCEFMMGSPPGILIKLCWKFLCPIALTIIFIAGTTSYERLTFGEYVYPNWISILAVVVVALAFQMIPSCALHHFMRSGYCPHLVWANAGLFVNSLSVYTERNDCGDEGGEGAEDPEDRLSARKDAPTTTETTKRLLVARERLCSTTKRKL
ncbi:hypothetical protein ISCGN_024217 [Ixodes scapularis]